MAKVIRDIITSAFPPSNHHVLWLNTASGSPILMSWHKGEWAPVVSEGGSTDSIKKVDLGDIDSMLESGEIQPGEWVDITDSYLDRNDGIKMVPSQTPEIEGTTWCFTAQNQNIVEVIYLIQVFQSEATSFHGEAFVRTLDTNINWHMHFLLSKIDFDAENPWGGSLVGGKEPNRSYLITDCKVLDTNSSFNFDPFVITPILEKTEARQSFLRLPYSVDFSKIDGTRGIEGERISVCRDEEGFADTLPIGRIINSNITIGEWYPIYHKNTAIVNSTINNSILLNETFISLSTITHSVVSSSTIYNSVVTNCIYGVGDSSNYVHVEDYDYDSGDSIFSEEFTSFSLNLIDAKIQNVIFTPIGYYYMPVFDSPQYSWSEWYTLSKFDNLDLYAIGDQEGAGVGLQGIIMYTDGHIGIPEKPRNREFMNLFLGLPFSTTTGGYSCYLDLSELRSNAANYALYLPQRCIEKLSIDSRWKDDTMGEYEHSITLRTTSILD